MLADIANEDVVGSAGDGCTLAAAVDGCAFALDDGRAFVIDVAAVFSNSVTLDKRDAIEKAVVGVGACSGVGCCAGVGGRVDGGVGDGVGGGIGFDVVGCGVCASDSQNGRCSTKAGWQNTGQTCLLHEQVVLSPCSTISTPLSAAVHYLLATANPLGALSATHRLRASAVNRARKLAGDRVWCVMFAVIVSSSACCTRTPQSQKSKQKRSASACRANTHTLSLANYDPHSSAIAYWNAKAAAATARGGHAGKLIAVVGFTLRTRRRNNGQKQQQ